VSVTIPFRFVELYEDITSQICNLKMSKYYHSDHLIIILAVVGVVVVGLLSRLLNLQHFRYHKYRRCVP